MTNFDDELRQLRRQVDRKDHLKRILPELRRQREELSRRVADLEAAKLHEQRDVDRLEDRSLTAFFYNVVGKMDEKLDRERQEAYAAAVKYDAAHRELLTVEGDIRSYEGELAGLSDCETRYNKLLAEKAARLKASGSPAADELLGLESRMAYLEHRMDEVDEAMAAGRRAEDCARDVLAQLDSAEGWSTFDLLGGGLIADIAKHSRLDDAQRLIGELQAALRRFRTELADVGNIQVVGQVNIDGFLRFADYFFDGLFADWAVRDSIRNSQDQVTGTLREVGNVLSRLEHMMTADQAEWRQQKTRLEDLVIRSDL